MTLIYNIFQTLYNEVKSIAIDLDIVITYPRTVKKQSLRANYETESCEDYYWVSIFIPFIESILQSKKERFEKKLTMHFYYNIFIPTFLKNWRKKCILRVLKNFLISIKLIIYKLKQKVGTVFSKIRTAKILISSIC
jgi:hypothetical protein